MTNARTSGRALAALAGAALLASTLAASSASAMPLAVPAGASHVAGPIEKVWWDRWGYWHPNRARAVWRCWRRPWAPPRCGWVRAW